MNQPLIKEQMVRRPLIVGPKMLASEAMAFMKQFSIRHLPVIEDQKVVGVISERDLKQIACFSGPGELLVEDLMVRDPYTVGKSARLVDVVENMYQNKYGCVIVEDENRKPIGIFTTTDAMRVLLKLLREDTDLPYYLEPIERFFFPYPNALL